MTQDRGRVLVRLLRQGRIHNQESKGTMQRNELSEDEESSQLQWKLTGPSCGTRDMDPTKQNLSTLE
jgi:hypothetical protein